MENINTTRIGLKTKYWLYEVYGPAVLLIILLTIGFLKLGDGLYGLFVFGFIVSFLILFSGIRKGKNTYLIFDTSGLQFRENQRSFSFNWDEIKAVRASDNTANKFIHIYTDEQTAYIPYRFFDHELVLTSLRKILPEGAFNQEAYQKTAQYIEWQKANWSEFSILEQRLKVYCNRYERWLGIVGVGFGTAYSAYLYSAGEYIGALIIGIIIVGSGLFLLLSSLVWIEATDQEIAVQVLFRQKSMLWEDIQEIYVNSRQGITILKSQEEKLILPKSTGWAGKDREQLIRLFNYKIEATGIEPKENQKAHWFFGKNKS